MKDFSEFASKNIEEVVAALKTSLSGLSQKEAVLRQKEFGFNEIKSNGNTVWNILMRQLKSPFFYLIAGAAVVSFLMGQKIDAGVIFVTALANVLISFFQEYKAERALYLLKKFIPQNVKVLRGGEEKKGLGAPTEEVIEKKNLVPGDVVLLEGGDIVPAGLRIIE